MSDDPRVERSVESLCSRLQALLPAKAGSLTIGIDGFAGVGKSRLATEIARRLCGKVISVDKHVERHKGAYTECVRCPEVRDQLFSEQRPVVLEGVCLRAVAERCQIYVHTHIYVRCINRRGSWQKEHEEICLEARPLQEIKAQEVELGAPRLTQILIDYHRQHRPFQRADIVFDLPVGSDEPTDEARRVVT